MKIPLQYMNFSLVHRFMGLDFWNYGLWNAWHILCRFLLISLLLKVVFSNITGIIFGLGGIRQVFI